MSVDLDGKGLLRIPVLMTMLILIGLYPSEGGERSSGSNEPLQKQTGAPKISYRIMEAYPNSIQSKLRRRKESLAVIPKHIDGMEANFVIRTVRTWDPGQSVKVAFRGGTLQLHEQVATAASEWTKYGNIVLDFGLDRQTGKYREWSTTDQNFTSEIRISFDRRGYWSLVGKESIDPGVTRPGEASMNFEGFDSALPPEWNETVLHEFGHALGFEHEHQHPTGGCDKAFRWQDDPGYVETYGDNDEYIPDPTGRRPGIYTVMSGPPNCWSKSKVNFALRQLQSDDSNAFKVGPFDKYSIMKYYFDGWMLIEGERSRCYNKKNVTLSVEDRKGILEAYPKDRQGIERVVRFKFKALNALASSPKLGAEIKQRYQHQLQGLQDQYKFSSM